MTLPPPLMTSEPGSFARSTIVERKPQLIRQVLEDNDYPPDINERLQVFRGEIAARPIQALLENAPDAVDWNNEGEKYRGKTWLEIPWYFAEVYFYRRLLEAVRYFQPGVLYRQDPFRKQKERQINKDIMRLSGEWDNLFNLPQDAALKTLLYSSLWGNRADLSNLTVNEKVRSGLAASAEAHLVLIDDTDKVCSLLSRGAKRVDFITDNVGVDILFDLAVADYLLSQHLVDRAVFNLKNQPFFVSDAMPDDVRLIITALCNSPDAALQLFGSRLSQNLDGGSLVLQEDPFWTSWMMFRQLPAAICDDLAQSELVFIKGDVNYRRLLDDAHWPYTTRMQDAVDYFPARFVTLRTLKGEIMVGLQPGQAEALEAQDPAWLVNGKRGVIQLV